MDKLGWVFQIHLSPGGRESEGLRPLARPSGLLVRMP